MRSLGAHIALPLTLIALALTLLSNSTASAQSDLAGAEIKKLFAGKSMSLSKIQGRYTGGISWRSNGTLTGYVNILGIPNSADGTWWINGNKYCRKIRGEEKCFRVRNVGRNVYHLLNDDDSVESIGALIQ